MPTVNLSARSRVNQLSLVLCQRRRRLENPPPQGGSVLRFAFVLESQFNFSHPFAQLFVFLQSRHRFDPHRVQMDILRHFANVWFGIFKNKCLISSLKHMTAGVVAVVVQAVKDVRNDRMKAPRFASRVRR